MNTLWGIPYCLLPSRRLPASLALAALATQISACALIKPAEPPRDTYELTAPNRISSVRGGTGAQILVKLPNALKSIDSDRLIVRQGAAEITYLAGAQWSDTVPRMVQAKLVEAFENTESTGATAKPGDGLVIDYQLISDIRRFEIDADGTAVIEMSIKLLADRSGKVLETRVFTATTPTVDNDAKVLVAAIDDAFDELARSIINWVVNRV